MTRLELSAWFSHADAGAWQSLERHGARLQALHPLWYLAGPAGAPAHSQAATPQARERLRELAKARGCALWPQAAAEPGLLGRLCEEGPLRRAHVAALLRLVQDDGAAGLCFDYGAPPAGRAEAWVALAEELGLFLRAAGRKLALSLDPAALEDPGLSPALLRRVSLACDKLQLFAFERRSPAPGPLAAPAALAARLEPLRGALPSDRLELVLPALGWKRGPGGEAEMDWAAWAALVMAEGPERRDAASAELSLAEARICDAHAWAAKLWTARAAGLHRVGAWRLGWEDPRLWALVENLPEDFLGPRA